MSVDLFVDLGVAPLLAAGCLRLLKASRARASAWREAARIVHMTEITKSRWFGLSTGLKGHVGGLPVSMGICWAHPQAEGTRAVADGLGHPGRGSPHGFELLADMDSALPKALGARELVDEVPSRARRTRGHRRPGAAAGR